jgi:8-amino-7-oxononanoate synthase
MESWRRQLRELEGQGMLRFLRTVGGAQGPRVRLEGREVLLLCSNNYLGLADHPTLREAAAEAAGRFGVGSGGSRLISGSMELHLQLEERLAAFKGTEAALLYNSGYAANTGILQGLFGPDDVIFSDELNHASIIDGCRLSRARTVVFPHRNTGALEALMSAETPRRRGRWVIVTDGVFSMDGDLAPLPELIRLKERFDALFMVDDAHGTGVLGASGRGTAEHFGCMENVDLQMGTLGKALGCFGAYLAAKRAVVDTLVNRSRAFIFSTSLPPAVPASALAALDVVESAEGEALRKALWRNREIFVQRLEEAGRDLSAGASQIVPVLTREPAPTIAAAEKLLTEGIFVQGIRPPTVPPGGCRLRATVMALHEPEDLLRAADAINKVLGGGEG